MTEAAKTQTYRPPEDIMEDIAALVRGYPPLRQSQNWFKYTVANGVVTLSGHIKSSVAERVLVDSLQHVPGVIGVDSSALYNDQELRLQLGQLVPAGVWVQVDFGRAIIDGDVPPGYDVDALEAKLLAVPGVRKVENWFAG